VGRGQQCWYHLSVHRKVHTARKYLAQIQQGWG
jgi:hypothetical protein